MDDDSITIEDLNNAGQIASIGGVSIATIVEDHPKLIQEIRQFSPVKSASTFGALLIYPEIQSNCLRLEVLVHLCVSFGVGKKAPGQKEIARWFSILDDGLCGSYEDPAEDVFVSLVSTPLGNYRVLEGIWESAGFYLQRVLNTVEMLPSGSRYDELRSSINALLRLSDIICERRRLVRYQLGNPYPEQRLPVSILKNKSSIRRNVSFSMPELEALKISLEDLAVFGFLPKDRQMLREEQLGHTTLERHPLAHENNRIYILLPTAISAAIRRLVIEQMRQFRMTESFLKGLAHEYAHCFSSVPLFGGRSEAPIKFIRTKNGVLSGYIERVDIGRYLNVIFFVDTLEEFDVSGLGGVNPDSSAMTEEFNSKVNHFIEIAEENADFKESLFILVSCGVGRGGVYDLDLPSSDKYRFLFLSAADLYTLSWVKDFKPITLWSLLDAKDHLKEMRIFLQNINGFLNLVAWVKSLDGHLVPHGEVPEGFNNTNGLIMVDQNAIRELRHEVFTSVDPHRIPYIDGSLICVRRINESLFDEDRDRPLYGGADRDENGGIPAVYLTTKRPWWIEIKADKSVSGYSKYARWQMLTVWISRSAPILDNTLTNLPKGPILLCAKFDFCGETGKIDFERKDYDFALQTIDYEVDHQNCTLNLIVKSEFEQAVFHPENIAERALVTRIVEGFSKLAGSKLTINEVMEVVSKIIPDGKARQFHAFHAKEFRDFVRKSIPNDTITIDSEDDAALRLGLGWRARKLSNGSIVRGKSECTKFLNDTVRLLENEVCQELNKYDRKKLILHVLQNHESADVNREWWRRTSGAVISLRKNKEAARETIISHEMELNAVFQATRSLIEMAICECPLNDGSVVGKLEFSRLMAKVLLICRLGGCSDAIHWDVMEPVVKITPLGDIHLNYDYFDNVLSPFGKVGIDKSIDSSIENYHKRMEEPDICVSAEEAFEKEFNEAWKNEMGASVDDMRRFVDFIEDVGMKENSAILTKAKSDFLPNEADNTLPKEVAQIIIDNMTLYSRSSWRHIPNELSNKDILLWKFRRRLTVLRKPFIQINNDNDPITIVAPGILRDSLSYMLQNYYRGDFPDVQMKTQEMISWIGKSMNKRGNAFSKTVGETLLNLGWHVEVEIKITKLLRKGFDKNYGDIDVLAWNDNVNRVLLIECKNLQYKKTPGEIAEQISDFRGEIKSNGKPDLLRKHLDRIELVEQHMDELRKYFGVDRDIILEGHLVFKDPVPMQYAWEHLKHVCPISIHDDLDEFRI